MAFCIGVDLGGTNISAGIVDLNTKRIIKRGGIKTRAPRSCEEISRDIVELCLRLCRQSDIPLKTMRWIGVASPGIVKDGSVVSANNLGWKDAPLAECIASLSGINAFAANDANAAAYAEAMWGIGKGYSSLVAITLGTGVGGGVVINGKIWEGINGFAAELGHVIVNMEGRQCSCGKQGCLETYCSASSLIKECRRNMTAHTDSLLWQMCDGDSSRINSAHIFKAHALGDAVANAVVSDFIKHLAMGVSNVINIFQPDVVCIGGGLSAEGNSFIDSLRENVKRLSFGLENKRTRVETAMFLNDAGIIGGGLLGLQEKFV